MLKQGCFKSEFQSSASVNPDIPVFDKRIELHNPINFSKIDR